MPIDFGLEINFTEILKVPSEHKLKVKQKPQPKSKHQVEVEESKTNPN